MQKPEFEVIRLNEEMNTVASCDAYCTSDCGVNEPFCFAECVSYEEDCPWY